VVREGVARLLETRTAATAGMGQSERSGHADSGQDAGYGTGPEYPARPHPDPLRDMKPGHKTAPAVPSGMAGAALHG